LVGHGALQIEQFRHAGAAGIQQVDQLAGLMTSG
jgi:hypothetical protein